MILTLHHVKSNLIIFIMFGFVLIIYYLEIVSGQLFKLKIFENHLLN